MKLPIPCFRTTLVNGETVDILRPMIHRSEQQEKRLGDSPTYGKLQKIEAITGITTEGNELLIPFNQVSFVDAGYFNPDNCLFTPADAPNRVINLNHITKEFNQNVVVLGI